MSKADAEEVKRDYWAIFNGIEAPPGEAAVAVASARAAEFEAKYRARNRERPTACSATLAH